MNFGERFFMSDSEFELELTRADEDWIGTRVAFQLEARGALTRVRSQHPDGPSANEHYRIFNHCWAMDLRVLRRSLEHDESVPYEARLDV